MVTDLGSCSLHGRRAEPVSMEGALETFPPLRGGAWIVAVEIPEQQMYGANLPFLEQG